MNIMKRGESHKILKCLKKQFSTQVKFNGTYYEQVDGVAMGSPLGPTLANIFLCHWEEIWLEKCPLKFKPLYYKRYMDDTFLLFSSINIKSSSLISLLKKNRWIFLNFFLIFSYGRVILQTKLSFVRIQKMVLK